MNKKTLKMIDEASANFRKGKVSDPIDVQPMSPPKDKVYYMETLYNGKTSEQIFQEDLAAGKYVYAGKEIDITIIRRHRFIHVLDGSPQPPMPIEKVVMMRHDRYTSTDGGCLTYLRNPIKLKEWTPEEWEKEKYNYVGYSISEF